MRGAASTAGPARVAAARAAWLAAAAALLFGNWEWLQTPFYDGRGAAIDAIVYDRLHCTVVDVLILLGCAAAVAVLRRGAVLIRPPRTGDLALLAVFGTAYTAVSEQVNVGIKAAWAYSPLMPVVPGTSIGVVPLLQWVILPPLAAVLAARLRRGGREHRVPAACGPSEGNGPGPGGP